MIRHESWTDDIAAVLLVLLLFILAWGNTFAMFLVAAVGLTIGLLYYGGDRRRGTYVAGAACAVALLIALGLLFG